LPACLPQRAAAPKSPEVDDSPQRARRPRTEPAPAALAVDEGNDFGFANDYDDDAYDAPQAATAAANRANAAHAAQSSSSRQVAAATTATLREARDKLLAYEDRDPLLEALGPAHKETARVSRETLAKSSAAGYGCYSSFVVSVQY
jgi:hypothetical protein